MAAVLQLSDFDIAAFPPHMPTILWDIRTAEYVNFHHIVFYLSWTVPIMFH